MQWAESSPTLRFLEGGADDQTFPIPGQMENALSYLRARLALQAPKLALNSLWTGRSLEVQRAPLRAPHKGCPAQTHPTMSPRNYGERPPSTLFLSYLREL